MSRQTAERRDGGIEFGAVDRALERHDYPTSTATLVDVHGDREVGLARGSASLRELLAPLERTYDSPREVREAIFSMVGSEALRRPDYTDRGHVTPEEHAGDQQSF